MRRSTTEIQTASLPDPQYQRDTVDGTQTSLDQEYHSLYNLVKVGEERGSMGNVVWSWDEIKSLGVGLFLRF